MRQAIELVLIIIIFVTCFLFRDPQHGDFICNIAYSTASACIFYLFFTTIPGIIDHYQKTQRYLECLANIFECCANFDLYLGIVSDQTFIGNDGGHNSFFLHKKTNITNFYRFNGKISRLGRGTKREATEDLCHALIEIINETELLPTRIRSITESLNKIQSKIANQHTDNNSDTSIQPFRSSVWRRVEDIYYEISKRSYYRYRLDHILRKKKINIKIKNITK